MDGLYRTDFTAWTREQAQRLREARPNAVDWENLAEEIEALGRSDYHSAASFVIRIIEHLLKLEYSPAADPRDDWKDSILRARIGFRRVSTKTIVNDLTAELEQLYADGRKLAARGLQRDGIESKFLPDSSPYTLEQIAADDWYPVSRQGIVDPD